jgi:N-acetylglutamate synthase-like GNAT family acetyltransferase
MTTSTKAKVRRAKPTDVVNLYRLVAEGQEQNSLAPVDETLALGYVLTVIEKGLVLVAEHSGRLVGSIGFDTVKPQFSKETALVSVWFQVVPAYKQTTIGLALLRRALAIIDEYGIAVRLSTCTSDQRIDRWLKACEFTPRVTVWQREGVAKDEQVPDTSGGSDSGDSDPGAEPAQPESEPGDGGEEPAPADPVG